MRISGIFKLVVILLIITFIICGIVFLSIVFTLPRLPDSLPEIAMNNPTEIYSDSGDLITVLSPRQSVKLSQISPYFLKAIVAVEDVEFFHHRGINKRGLLRMMF
ncbi:transglycosylase domain-containing protein, partial [candidate division KSB1 bacterium]|nr:transglycosylase domain-containing protein [candidate division KSB1 bacterium]